MNYVVQWVIVAALVAAAVVFLVKRLKPSKKGCCCEGCPYAGSCAGEEKDGECPAPNPAKTEEHYQ